MNIGALVADGSLLIAIPIASIAATIAGTPTATRITSAVAPSRAATA